MTVAIEALSAFVTDLFQAAGLPAADARSVAEVFVLQETRGVRTHGLRRIQRNLTWVLDGEVNPTPARTVVHEAGATLVLDGDHGLGMLGCRDGMTRAIAAARQYGLGMTVVINSNHFLSAAPYCLQAADAGLIGIACSNTYASMGYPGAATRVIGNGPIGFAAPTAAGYPLVFDAALSASYGKLTEWLRTGQTVPAYLPAIDAAGRATTDPGAVLDDGVPMPIGMHKGAGLVLLIEILTGLLGGGAYLTGIVPPHQRASKADAESQCCIAVDVAHFMPVDAFTERMAAFIADLKRQPLAEDCREIVVPGENAVRVQAACREHGVPVEPDVADELAGLARRVGVTTPW